MKHRIFLYLTILSALAFATQLGRGADLSQATVRQKVNLVTRAPHPNAAFQPISEGAVVRDDNVVRTGAESRAELQFTDLTLARLGANAIFSFDAGTRVLEVERGAVLFSKPANSGRIEIRSAAVSAAITGSTGFISNTVGAAPRKRTTQAKVEEATTVLGMLEGKLKGTSSWRDARGREHTFPFSLGPGEMLVGQTGQPPAVVQFDIPRFLKTSPLVKGFKGKLNNQAELAKAVANYEADQRRGFIDSVRPAGANVAWLNYAPNHNSFDASVDQLSQSRSPLSSGGNDGFIDIGSEGIIRGQLVWTSDADLDLHLILPDQQEVFYANPSVTFNNGRATAVLDHDNLGGIIDEAPDRRVENIAVNGVPSNGSYTFFAHSFFSDNGSDTFTLTVRGSDGRTQQISGSLTNGQTSNSVVVNVPPGG